MTSELKATGNWIDDIARMHLKYGVHSSVMNQTQFVGRLKFLREELDETIDAAESNDSEGVVDGLIDLGVVASGTLDMLHVDGNLAWQEVFRANMQKEVGFNPSRPDSQGVDLVKPEGWIPPSHSGNVGILPELLPGFSMKKFEKKFAWEELLSFQHKYSIDILREVFSLTFCVDQESGIEDQLAKLKVGLEDMKSVVLQYSITRDPQLIRSDIVYSLETKLFDFIVECCWTCCKFNDVKERSQIRSVLLDCANIQFRKSQDYNSEVSITQADYYPDGIKDILYMLHLKLCRVISVYDNYKMGISVVHESLGDSLKDAVNYASFGVSWIRGRLEGQNTSNDIFNKPYSDDSTIIQLKIAKTAIDDVLSDREFIHGCSSYVKSRCTDAMESINNIIQKGLF